MPGDRYEQVIGIARIDRDLRDLLAVAQAEMRPAFARVGRFVDVRRRRKDRVDADLRRFPT